MKDYSSYHSSPEDKYLADGQRLFNIRLNSFEGNDGYIDDVPVRFVLERRSNLTNQLHGEYYLLCDSSVGIHTGSVVKDENDISYLVSANVEETLVYKKTLIKTCTHTLDLYKNGLLFQKVPCCVESSVQLYRMGINEGKYINIPEGTIVVRVPFNDVTSNLNRGQTYKIGLQNWKITDINDVIESGILVLKMEFSFDAEERANMPDYTVEILNGAEQVVQYGKTLQLNIQVKNKGELVLPTPSIVYETSKGTICTVDANGIITATSDSGSAVITAKLSSDVNVFANITIKTSSVSHVNYNYTLTGNIQPDNEILYNQSKSYIATKLDSNNNIIETQFLFQVIGNIPTDKYVLTKMSDNQCLLKCSAYNYSLILRAIDISNSQYIDKAITFKRLL